MWDQWLIWVLIIAGIHGLTILFGIPWILSAKKDPVSAVAWCLFTVFIPIFGFLTFVWFGYARIERPLKRKRRHRACQKGPSGECEDQSTSEPSAEISTWNNLGQYATAIGACPVTNGNAVEIYRETTTAYQKILEAIQAARHHVHVEFYIFRADNTGRALRDLLVQKAQEGVEVRLLYDGVGAWSLRRGWLEPLERAGGEQESFLPINPFRNLTINLRNHRKIVVVDGKVGFTGGMNIGDEYLGQSSTYGPWRDTHLRVEGPAVLGLQDVFREDWTFAGKDWFDSEKYFPPNHQPGSSVVQIAESGPDREVSVVRDVLFAAMTMARERVWLTTPYFIPDSGLKDVLRMLLSRGLDVRILLPGKVDYQVAYYASHYHLHDLMKQGMKVYEYQPGMMHAKTMVVDDHWATVGTVNFDNRSLHLNFEANCFFYSTKEVEAVASHFERDLEESKMLDEKYCESKSRWRHIKEDISRIFSPIL